MKKAQGQNFVLTIHAQYNYYVDVDSKYKEKQLISFMYPGIESKRVVALIMAVYDIAFEDENKIIIFAYIIKELEFTFLEPTELLNVEVL